MADFDLIVRGGTIIDGSGKPGFLGDIGVKGGVIAAVGKVDGTADEEVDATGFTVTPGFVDIHTHYDGQVSWDDTLTPSSQHGVTTVVMGNCGVGFAPAAPDRHDWLIALMEGVEDIPGAALAEGIDWQWESFPEYMDAIGKKSFTIDVAAQVPHGALRAYVMGERGANREPATEKDMAEMARLTAEAIEAGAIGFTTSRTMNHRSRDGDPAPTLDAAHEEVLTIAEAIGKTGKGVLQFVGDMIDLESEFGLIEQAVERSKRPASLSLVQADVVPDRWRQILDKIEGANAKGLPVKAQVAARPVGLLLGLQASFNPFIGTKAYQEIADLPLDEKVAEMQKPARKAAILAERPEKLQPLLIQIANSPHKLFELGNPAEYEPGPEHSIAARAKEIGLDPQELTYDLLIADGGRKLLYFPVYNYTDGDLSNLMEMLTHKDAIYGLGDGGAHCGVICDGSFVTTMMTHWVRDRTRGPKLPLEEVVHGYTRRTAEAVGLTDRGLIKEGLKADINVIDLEGLTLKAPEMAFDLPAGGKRLVQFADGYKATIVSGEVIQKDGAFTDARPGRLIRA